MEEEQNLFFQMSITWVSNVENMHMHSDFKSQKHALSIGNVGF